MTKIAEDESNWVKMNQMVDAWRAEICNMSGEGWVQTEDYKEAKREVH
jgi:hypothetical protein